MSARNSGSAPSSELRITAFMIPPGLNQRSIPALIVSKSAGVYVRSDSCFIFSK